jgi:hypothetical protein
MRLARFISLLILMTINTGPAFANVLYTFYGNLSGAYNGPFQETLVVTDAAVEAGGLSFSIRSPGLLCGPSSPPYFIVCLVTGDPSGFVSLTDSSFTSTTGFGSILNVGLEFNPDGTLTGFITEHGENQDLVISGSEFDWTGALSSDRLSLCGNCSVAGYWATSLPLPVPEPPTIALFGIGITFSAGFCYRRNRARSKMCLQPNSRYSAVGSELNSKTRLVTGI